MPIATSAILSPELLYWFIYPTLVQTLSLAMLYISYISYDFKIENPPKWKFQDTIYAYVAGFRG